MSTFRRRLMMAAQNLMQYALAWFRTDGWFGSEPW